MDVFTDYFFKERLASFLGRLAGERRRSAAFGVGRHPCGVSVAFFVVVVMDLVTKWIALVHGYLESQRERDSDFLSCLAVIPDMRWDLLYLPDYENDGVLVPDGKLLRGKAEFYRTQMISQNVLT